MAEEAARKLLPGKTWGTGSPVGPATLAGDQGGDAELFSAVSHPNPCCLCLWTPTMEISRVLGILRACWDPGPGQMS